MADNSPLDEALAMVGDTVGPDTPQNVRQEKPRLPPQITAGMCRFFKDLKSHENPGVKIRIEYKEKDVNLGNAPAPLTPAHDGFRRVGVH